MEWLKITTISIIGLIAFIGMYCSFECIHKCEVVQAQIDSIKIEQIKMDYFIKNNQDTIVIKNYINIKQNK